LPHQAVERDRGERHEAGVAVRPEHGKAQRRLGDIEVIHGHSADRNTAGTRVASPGPMSAFGRNPENICSRELFAFDPKRSFRMQKRIRCYGCRL